MEEVEGEEDEFMLHYDYCYYLFYGSTLVPSAKLDKFCYNIYSRKGYIINGIPQIVMESQTFKRAIQIPMVHNTFHYCLNTYSTAKKTSRILDFGLSTSEGIANYVVENAANLLIATTSINEKAKYLDEKAAGGIDMIHNGIIKFQRKCGESKQDLTARAFEHMEKSMDKIEEICHPIMLPASPDVPKELNQSYTLAAQRLTDLYSRLFFGAIESIRNLEMETVKMHVSKGAENTYQILEKCADWIRISVKDLIGRILWAGGKLGDIAAIFLEDFRRFIEFIENNFTIIKGAYHLKIIKNNLLKLEHALSA